MKITEQTKWKVISWITERVLRDILCICKSIEYNVNELESNEVCMQLF